MNAITIPHNFNPRSYQLPFFKAMDSGIKRAIKVWHRRAGKDKCDFNYLIKEMCNRVGTYAYFFPTASQGRKAIWLHIDSAGFSMLDHIPKELVARKNDQEMRVHLVNGSVFQIIGTDKIENVGAGYVGMVFSEFSLQTKAAWDYMRPILMENDGWAVFNFTPRGKNHAYQMLMDAKKNKNWFTEILTADDTNVMTKEKLDEERKMGCTEDMIQQEFYCSFNMGIEGSYYGSLMQDASLQERITAVPYDYNVPVYTAWDLGISDTNPIWFFQMVGKNIHVIDYYETSGQSLTHYWDILKEKGYTYGEHFAPHDIEARELSTGISRKEFARNMGLNFTTVPRTRIDEGIEQVRAKLPNCWFDEDKCYDGIQSLINYHKKYDVKHECYSDVPVHDKSSHGADGFRTLAMALRQGRTLGEDTHSGASELQRLANRYRRPA